MFLQNIHISMWNRWHIISTWSMVVELQVIRLCLRVVFVSIRFRFLILLCGEKAWYFCQGAGKSPFSHICSNQNTCFKPSKHIFQTLTNCFLCLNPTENCTLRNIGMQRIQRCLVLLTFSDNTRLLVVIVIIQSTRMDTNYKCLYLL